MTMDPLFLGQAATQLRHSHPERVFDVAFSGDGRLLASASEANEARLWAADGPAGTPPSLLGKPLAHDAEVLRVAWGPATGSDSSDMLASATATGRVRLHRVALGPADEEGQGAGREVAVRVAAEFGHRQQGQVYALKWVGARGGSGSELMTALDDKCFFWDVSRCGGPSVVAKWEFQHLPGADSFGGHARNPDRTSYIFDAAVGCLGPQQGSSPVVCLALSDGSVRIHDRRSARAVATLRRSASAHLTSLW
jgi:WD40 repeat protein